ncbi:MAG: hypothetical protein BWY31_04026 [Lentisphaerae bacterium ADurb.Bin242]|nr:MAG: hypothetical protein BWY31_04026 [Lentisphaerae bacterium ADurb.Bin242]
MKFTTGIFMLAVAASLAAMDLAKNGNACVDIVINGKDILPAERTAATELKNYLEKITGAKFVLRDEAAAGNKNAIYVGHTAFAASKGIEADPDTSKKEDWILKSEGNSFVITGSRPRGTLYGVFDFLERYGGIRFLAYDCTVIPKKEELAVPDNIHVKKGPAFYSRWYVPGVLPQDSPNFFLFLNRNRYNPAYIAPERGGLELFGQPGMCHTFYAYSKDFPADKPEYFSMNASGTRERAVSAIGPGQLCLTHPEVRRRMIEKLISYIKGDQARSRLLVYPPRIYVITGNDNTSYCRCDSCMAYTKKGGNYTDTTLAFINHIAEAVEKDYPDVKILTMAYTYTIEPPKFEKPRKNVIIQLANLGKEFTGSGLSETLRPISDPSNREFARILEAWKTIAPELFVWDYWVLYCKGFQFPYINTVRMAGDMKKFAESNAKGMLIESEAPDGSFFAFRQYFGMQLMLDPFHDKNVLIDDFFHGYYGKSAGTMKDYLKLVENSVIKEKTSFALELPRQFSYLNGDFFEKANALLDRAETQSADSPEVRERIRLERIPVDRAMLSLGAACDRTKVVDRLEANGRLLLAKYQFPPERVKTIRDVISVLRMNLQLPDPFKGKNATDFTWIDLAPASHVNVKLVDDSGACGGRAIRIGQYGEKATHKLPYETGVYNRLSKTFGPTLRLKEVPQDGQYHFFKIGEFNILPGTILHAPWNWYFQTSLDKAYPSAPENLCEVYVSLKFTGPVYVKDSKEENAVYIDRIITVRK